jgi:hypothetical protein
MYTKLPHGGMAKTEKKIISDMFAHVAQVNRICKSSCQNHRPIEIMEVELRTRYGNQSQQSRGEHSIA